MLMETQKTQSSLLLCGNCKVNIPYLVFHGIDNEVKLRYKCSCLHDPKAFDVKSLLEKSPKGQRSNIKCSTHDLNVEKYCPQCNKWLCNKCIITHQTDKPSHSLLDYEIHVACLMHEKPFISYCKTCNENICELCHNHQSHERINLKKTNLSSLLEDFQSLTRIKDNNKQAVTELLELIQKNIAKAEANLKELLEFKKEITSLSKNDVIYQGLINFINCFITTAMILENYPSYQIQSLHESIDLTKMSELKFTDNIESNLAILSQYNINSVFIKQKNIIKGILKDSHNSINNIIELSSGKIVTNSIDSIVRIWDNLTLKVSAIIQNQSQVLNILEYHDGRLIVTSKYDINLYNMNSYSIDQSYKVRYSVNTMIELIDGRLASPNDKIILLYDLQSKEKLKSLEPIKGFAGHTDYIFQILQMPDGQLVSRSRDQIIKFWNTVTGECNMNLNTQHNSFCNMILLKEGMLAICSWDNTIKIFDSFSYKCIITIYGHSSPISQMCQLKNGKLLTCSSDGLVKVWNELMLKIDYNNRINQDCLLEMKNKILVMDKKKTNHCIVTKCELTLSEDLGIITQIIELKDGRILSHSNDSIGKIWEI